MQASLVNRSALADAQQASDVMAAHRMLKLAYTTDVSPILAEARLRRGGALTPIETYRASGYRITKTGERPAVAGSSSGIV